MFRGFQVSFSIASLKLSDLFLLLFPTPNSEENGHQMHSASLKVTRAPLQICRSCFQCLFCLMAGVSTSSAWNRERSEWVFWHSQTCTRPRQEKIDAIVHFPQSREGSGALNPRPTMFVRGICFSKVFSFATFLCETFLLVLVIFLSYPLYRVTAPVS